MRLIVALMTHVVLVAGASAQSISPGLEGRGLSPGLPIVPSLAAPVPIATTEVHRAPVSIVTPDAKLIEEMEARRDNHVVPGKGATAIDEKLDGVRRSRSERARTEPKRPPENFAYQPTQRLRPVARDVGRFSPPVF